ncbi:hypothetical protein ACSSS7_001526 [Eimeria intestinalis]
MWQPVFVFRRFSRSSLKAGGEHRLRAGLKADVPLNLFTRSSPLKVRLVHRELASEYSAYNVSDGGPPFGALLPGGMGGAEQQPQENLAYHLVFSYDPAVLSEKDGDHAFRYLEGQSVSFFIKDRRPGAPDEGPPKPRLYSVASSPVAPDLGLKYSFSLCVRHHRYWGPDGGRDFSKDGMCSSSLCTAAMGTQFDVGGPIGASLLMPEDASVPLIFACTGTGVAPLRSFLRRLSVIPRGGPLIAYVGAGSASTSPYAREWGHLEKLLPPDKLNIRFAFSREMRNRQGGKLYVQDLIEEDGEKLLQLLAAGGIMYTCGRKDMVPPIKAALQAAAEKSNLPFDSFFKHLIATKRWRTEVY